MFDDSVVLVLADACVDDGVELVGLGVLDRIARDQFGGVDGWHLFWPDIEQGVGVCVGI